MAKKESQLKIWRNEFNKVNWQYYVNSYNKSLLWFSLSLFAVVSIFNIPIRNFIKQALVPLLSEIEQNNLWISLIFLSFFIIGAYYFFSKISKHLIISINSLVVIGLITIAYVVYLRFDTTLNFYKLSIPYLPNWAYADLFLTSAVFLMSNYKTSFKSHHIKASNLSLIEDTSLIDGYEDVYGRERYASKIADHINATSTLQSFAIGIIGTWGSGKTDFMYRLKKSLSTNDDNLIIWFNPWRVNKAESIIKEFFKALSEKLRPFNQSISGKIKEYTKTILEPADQIQFRAIASLAKSFDEDSNLESQYDRINFEIQATGKRIIIFIDDVDRLTGDEIMEVLRIIRNTANFSNTFFITGIDQSYIVSTLRNTGNFSNEEQYLQKVFQLTITLPAFKKTIFPKLLKDLLTKSRLKVTNKDKEIFEKIIDKLTFNFQDISSIIYPGMQHEYILEPMVENIRDLKKFCNSFLISYEILKGEVDLHDLFVLELIRNCDIEIYNLIRNRTLINFKDDSTNNFIIRSEEWSKITFAAKDNFQQANKIASIGSALTYLLTDESYKNQRKFLLISNFYLYFSYQLFNLISFREFNETIELSSEEISNKFEEWSKDGKQNELLEVANYLVDFSDADFLNKIVVAFLNVESNKLNWVTYATRLIFLFRENNHKRYFNSDFSLHKSFLQLLFNDRRISLFDRANLAGLFLHEHISPKGDKQYLILTKVQLQKIILKLFEEYLIQAKEFNEELFDFYLLNQSGKNENNQVQITKEASRILKKTLLAKEPLFEGYVANVLRSREIPYKGNIGFDPYLPEIFGSLEDFRKILSDKDFTDQNLQRLKSIILRRINDERTGIFEGFKILDPEDDLFLKSWINRVKPKRFGY